MLSDLILRSHFDRNGVSKDGPVRWSTLRDAASRLLRVRSELLKPSPEEFARRSNGVRRNPRKGGDQEPPSRHPIEAMLNVTPVVMAGLGFPATDDCPLNSKDVDGRDEPGHDAA